MTWYEFFWARFISDLIYAGMGLAFFVVMAVCFFGFIFAREAWRKVVKRGK